MPAAVRAGVAVRRQAHSLLNHCLCTYRLLIATGSVRSGRRLLAQALKRTSEGMTTINTCPAHGMEEAALLLLLPSTQSHNARRLHVCAALHMTYRHIPSPGPRRTLSHHRTCKVPRLLS